MNFKNGGVQIWQNVCIAARALHSDTMFPTPTARQTEAGSPTSARLRLWRTVRPVPSIFAPVAFALASVRKRLKTTEFQFIGMPDQKVRHFDFLTGEIL